MRLELSNIAHAQLSDIYALGLERWGFIQAESYYNQLIDHLEALCDTKNLARPIDPELGLEGYRSRLGGHVIYHKTDGDDLLVVTILHERMDQVAHLNADWKTARFH